MYTNYLTQNIIDFRRFPLVAGLVLLALGLILPAQAQAANVTADVVAMDQVLVYNRMGAFNPAGMIFALARDVFPKGTLVVNQILINSCAVVSCSRGDVQLRDDKRPRPLTLRVNEGQTIAITLTNLLDLDDITHAENENPEIGLPPGESEQPVTRKVGIHINGMQWVTGPGDDGSKVGAQNSLVAPGETETYILYAEKEGAYAITSGPNLGGEGGSGAIANGLFGVMNVEPFDATWYRSQLTRAEMIMAADKHNTPTVLESDEMTKDGHPIINYDAVYPSTHPYAGRPILAILDGSEIFHSDLNAIIDGPMKNDLPVTQVYPNRGEPFREFTVAFHDEIKVVQAFPGWFDALPFTLGSVKDGFAINYGTGGIGSEIIANRLGVGPMNDCVDCKYEEFFLTSWAVGDPAMIVDIPANAGLEALAPGQAPTAETQGPKATKAFYPEDPSNVWHGYLNDRTKIRNIHVGSEHHLFHLHAHQWLFASLDDKSNYLDAQAIGPGAAFTYEITYGGGGNRNKTAGDSIFHCHFYPHFAQGMWGLWRVHDVFEMGTELDSDGKPAAGSRALPDGEIAAGTPIPGVVPLPTKAMAPMPGPATVVATGDIDGDTIDEPGSQVDLDEDGIPDIIEDSVIVAQNPGYPFFIPGVAGHRPPTPPMDLVADGGLPRHVITAGTAHAVQTATDFDKVLLTATGFQIPEGGTPAELAAMDFHGPQSATFYTHDSYTPDGSIATGLDGFEVNGLPPKKGAPYAEPCRGDSYDGGFSTAPIGNPRTYKASVIEIDADLNKVGWHFGQQRIIVLDGDVAATRAGTRAPEPFVMRANTGDCVDFDHTNLVPSVYQLDDYQVKTPTDVIGQHIHLVKFDVMSADGAANGWNYEDGTLSPDEVAERVHAFEADGGSWTGDDLGELGSRTTRQRWYIDPGWSGNVFTHDHYGPSTHQQAGLYATLLVEPEGSTWKDPVSGIAMGSRGDGGPTSWRADIIDNANDDAWREFYLEFSDFQLAYRSAQGDGAGFLNGPETPVNPSDRNEAGLPNILQPNCDNGSAGGPNGCRPEAISSADPGTFVVNYRNEPLALRLRDPATNDQAAGLAGDLSYAFSSQVTRADTKLNAVPSAWPYGIQTATQGALTGDPFTPLMRVYEGDKVYLRVQVGGQEEGHNFSMNGIRWLQQWNSGYSGFRNSQMAGISEYFIFRVPAMAAAKNAPLDNGQVFEDYMYQTGSSVDARWNGTWGIMRSYEGLLPDLQPLPSNPDGKVPPMDAKGKKGGKNNKPAFAGVCPTEAPERKFDIAAVRAADVLPDGTLEYNPDLHDPTGLLYVMKADLDPVTGMLKTQRRVEPLILRAAAGECIFVTLTNQFAADPLDLDGFNLMPMIVNQFNGNNVVPSREVGLHAQLVEYDMFESDGMNVGFNQVQTAAPGETVKYKWYAGKIDLNPETGERTAVPMEYGAINLMASDPIEGSSKGLIGALIIEPQGATWNDGSVTGKGKNKVTKQDGDPDPADPTGPTLTRAAVTINDADGNFLFRDFVVILQDDINLRFDDGGPVPIVAEEEESEDSGMKAINYRTEPIWDRLGIGPTADAAVTRAVDFTNAFASPDPVTPLFTAKAGDEVRFRVLKPGGHNRNHVFTLHGHLWARHPFNDGSTEIDPDNRHTFWHGEQMGHGPTNHVNVVPIGGAGVAGDYLYRDLVPVHVYNGIWGIFRVIDE
jgi:hypothetical protein